MNNENIDTVNIAVLENGELSIHWRVQLPSHDTTEHGDTNKPQVELGYLRAYLEGKGHNIKKVSHWEFIKSVRDIH
tara:strand:+ start:382 stop:609 length:228 start_codon:yes stop_codon:yes gene_type:complete